MCGHYTLSARGIVSFQQYLNLCFSDSSGHRTPDVFIFMMPRYKNHWPISISSHGYWTFDVPALRQLFQLNVPRQFMFCCLIRVLEILLHFLESLEIFMILVLWDFVSSARFLRWRVFWVWLLTPSLSIIRTVIVFGLFF